MAGFSDDALLTDGRCEKEAATTEFVGISSTGEENKALTAGACTCILGSPSCSVPRPHRLAVTS